MTIFTAAIEQASDILWNSLLLFLLVGTGVFFTIRLRGVQLRRFGEGFHRVFGNFTLRGKKADDQGMSSFQALATAIAAQVGTGNITGCATALVSGGPGALFWVWVSAFFGMATIYAEAVLAQRYRTTVNGKVTGGPAYYIRAAFKGTFGKVLAGVFSVLIILALGFMGNMVQSNSIGDAFHNAFGMSHLAVGIVVAVIAAFIFLGGVQRIAAVTEKIVPIMAAFYIVGCVVILVMNYKVLPNAFTQIFVLAFNPQAMAGGVAGVTVQQAMRFGVARGLFSNESGLGSAPIAAAAARTSQPVVQALISMTQTFIDTLVVCSMTGLVILVTGVWTSGKNGAPLTSYAFETGLPGELGGLIVTIGIILFAYSTILGWSYYGEKAIEYLLGSKAIIPYRWAFIISVGLGASMKLDLVWTLSDIFNALMAFPNLIGLIMLTPVVKAETLAYLRSLKKEPASEG